MRPGVYHWQHRYLNHRAEHAHQPTRQREHGMGRLKSPGHAQRFLAADAPIISPCRPRRHRFPAHAYRQEMTQRFQTWREIIDKTMAAPTAVPGDRLNESKHLTAGIALILGILEGWLSIC